MPVNPQQLTEYVKELGLPADQESTFLTTLQANDAAATQFVGQRLRHTDYTQKTQQLSTTLQQARQEAEQYQTALAAAENQRQEIARQLRDKEISLSQANQHLQYVKTAYNLDDTDIPPLTVANKTQAPEPAASVDVAALTKTIKTELMKSLIPELNATVRLPAIQQEIRDVHQELTGKRLTRAEMDALVVKCEESASQNRPLTLEQAWKDTYNIPQLQTAKTRADMEREIRSTIEAEHIARRTQEAVDSTRVQAPMFSPAASPVLGRNYGAPNAQPSQPAAQTQGAPAPSAPAPAPSIASPGASGAERAMMKFMERRAQGIPMGGAAPARP